MDYPDGYEYVDSLLDEREYGIIKIAKKSNTQKESPTHYIVKKGDSVYSVSKEYDISLYDLLRENRITDPTRLRIGDILKFPDPSLQNITTYNASFGKGTLPEEIEIAASKIQGFAPLKVSLNLKTKLPDVSLGSVQSGTLNTHPVGFPDLLGTGSLEEPYHYMWVLGNDRYCFDKQGEYVYETPGNYHVFLVISDKNNVEVVSNKISIHVKKKNVRKLHIKTKSHQYITINQVNEILDISGLLGLGSEKNKEIKLELKQAPHVFQDLGQGRLLSVKSGYSNLTVTKDNEQYVSHVFISPVPSKHSYEPPFNWYKTQFATGINGNCGPACVAMAIFWAKGEDIPVAKIRSEIGMPFSHGAINFPHMFTSFKKHGIKAAYTYINTFTDMKKIIDRGNIAIVVFNTRNISQVKGDPKKNLIGRYYSDAVGHYCVVKGYTVDGKYFIVYDPIPSDWETNSGRYADGVSMLGKNRYYRVPELFRTMGKKVVEISR